MLNLGSADRASEPEPIAHGFNLPERHTRLHHAEGTRIHTKKHDTFGGDGELAQISLMTSPRVLQRVVNVRNG